MKIYNFIVQPVFKKFCITILYVRCGNTAMTHSYAYFLRRYSLLTKFGEEWFIIPCCVNEKPWQWYRHQSSNLTYTLSQFLTPENVPGHDIHSYLCAVYKNWNIVTKSTVNHEVKSFKEGQMSTDDKACSGYPPESMNNEMIGVVHTLLEDQWRTVHEIEQQIVAEYPYVNVSLSLIHTVIHKHLKTTEVRARWVPCELTNEHWWDCMGAGLEFLLQYHEKCEAFLDQIMTGDECWVHFYTPELKRSSMRWKTKEKPTTKKFKALLLAGTITFTFFGDQEVLFLLEFISTKKEKRKCKTTTRYSYFDVIRRQTTKDKRRWMLSKHICLFHNTWPHIAHLITSVLDDFHW